MIKHLNITVLLILSIYLMSCSTSEDKSICRMCQYIHNQYPKATLQDIYKTCYQDFFGAEHLMNDTAAARFYINYELKQCENSDLSLMPYNEPTGFRHRFTRVNFSNIVEGKITEEQLVMRFINAAGKDNAYGDDWASEWKRIEEIALKVNPEWKDIELQQELTKAAENKQAVRHSEAFRNNYNPHYRIVRNK